MIVYQKHTRIVVSTVVFVFTLLSISYIYTNTKATYAQGNATCGTECCPCDGSGEYCCQYDEMCCTGGGCPSWVCTQDGQAPTIHPPSCRGLNSDNTWTCCDYSISEPYSINYTEDCDECGREPDVCTGTVVQDWCWNPYGGRTPYVPGSCPAWCNE